MSSSTEGASAPARSHLSGVVVRALAVTVVTATLALLGAAPAFAHAGLASSDPLDGEALDASPASVTLTFNQPLPPEFVVVTLVGNGTQISLDTPGVAGSTVTQPVPALADGQYEMGYRVVSEDGHPVAGSIKFTIEATGSSAAPTAAAAAPTAQPAPAASSDSGGVPVWIWLVVAVVVLAAAIVTVLRISRKADR